MGYWYSVGEAKHWAMVHKGSQRCNGKPDPWGHHQFHNAVVMSLLILRSNIECRILQAAPKRKRATACVLLFCRRAQRTEGPAQRREPTTPSHPSPTPDTSARKGWNFLVGDESILPPPLFPCLLVSPSPYYLESSLCCDFHTTWSGVKWHVRLIGR